jgi:3-isopropylmalate/(R)-2-methylmalate dehydratase small subunit
MEKFTVLTGVAVPIPMPKISTDLIAPSHFLGKKPEEAIVMSFNDKLLAKLRYFPDGTPKTDFVLDGTRYRGARILLTGENFGCGSSRETACRGWSRNPSTSPTTAGCR